MKCYQKIYESQKIGYRTINDIKNHIIAKKDISQEYKRFGKDSDQDIPAFIDSYILFLKEVLNANNNSLHDVTILIRNALKDKSTPEYSAAAWIWDM